MDRFNHAAKRRGRPATLLLIFCLLIAGQISVGGAQPAAKKPKEPPPRYAKLEGLRVHYKSYGRGNEALVFIHGWTCDLSFWRRQVDAFSSKIRVILVDLPGHGDSDKPQTAYTMDLFARAVAAVLSDAKVKRATLIGHSMGTPVIRQFYRKYPDKTRALVIVDGALRPYRTKEDMVKFTATLRGPDYPEAAGRFIDGMLGSHTSAALKSEIKTAMLRTPQHVALSAMDGMTEPEIWKADKIEVPVLAILAKSPFWPADNESYFRSIAANLDYRMWEDVSHFLMMEKPAEFNTALSAFLVKNKLIKN